MWVNKHMHTHCHINKFACIDTCINIHIHRNTCTLTLIYALTPLIHHLHKYTHTCSFRLSHTWTSLQNVLVLTMKSCSQFLFPDLQNTSITVDNQTFVSQSIADHPEKSMFTLLYGMIIVVMVVLLLVRAYIFMKVSEFWFCCSCICYALFVTYVDFKFTPGNFKDPTEFCKLCVDYLNIFCFGCGLLWSFDQLMVILYVISFLSSR